MRLTLGCTTLLIVLLSAALLSTPAGRAAPGVQATPALPGAQPVVVYFFWGDGCPHCAEAKPFLASLVQQYPNMELRAYEVWYNEPNQQLFQQMAAAYGFEPSGVPTIFIGERYWEGYAEPLKVVLAEAVANCAHQGCRDAGLGIVPGLPTPIRTLPPRAEVTRGVAVTPSAAPAERAAPVKIDRLTLPWIGAVDLTTQSLAVSTALIALVDGFNPCSLWVLSVLLALTLNTGSRRKVLWVGLVFLAVTALIYLTFITGLFTVFSVLPFVGSIRVLVALAAIVIAAINIKDYFWYKTGLSFTIADARKPGIYRAMRRVVNGGESLGGVLGATVLLAAGVSLVEFSCTAGFPVLWTNLLISQQASALTFVLLLLLYMLIYQLDELGIFLVAFITLRASPISEKQGRLLKLSGGLLMLTLAAVMLVNPTWMNQISSALLVFAVAFGATGLVLLLHRKLLPSLGIQIGSELAPVTNKPVRHHKRRL